MNWKTAAIGSLLTVLISANNDANAAQSVRTLALGVLRIGTYFVNPPFEYVSEGKNVGFEVDLMNEIARRLGLQPFFVNTQWELILQQMQDGLYDCIDGGITITSARQQMLAWSTPYMTTTLSLVLDSKRTPQIRSLAGLKEAAVGVQPATTDYDGAVTMQKRRQIKRIQVSLRPHQTGGLARKHPGLVAAVNGILADTGRDGTYACLANRWGVP